jgi:hypothetical protein
MKLVRAGALLGTLVLSCAVALLVGPVAQDPAYHLFADTRTIWGVPNFANVVSNLPFALVGGVALCRLLGPSGRKIFRLPADALPYLIFFVGVALVSLGSAYYHARPSNQSLVWDRLPMTIAFTALFAAFIADRIHRPIGLFVALPLLLAIGVSSVAYWHWTESAGRGDLRFYALVQFYPLAAMPLICWLYPKRFYIDGKYVAWIVGWYALAKIFEFYDARLLSILGYAISGHTLKHLAAAVAPLVVLKMLLAAKPVGHSSAVANASAPSPA